MTRLCLLGSRAKAQGANDASQPEKSQKNPLQATVSVHDHCLSSQGLFSLNLLLCCCFCHPIVSASRVPTIFMPIPTTSRYEPPFSPPSIAATPSRSSYSRTLTTTSAYSPTVTSLTAAGPLRLNVVSRVAIEGKAKQGQDGASIRMFLKVCFCFQISSFKALSSEISGQIGLPLDSVTPGSTIPLFAGKPFTPIYTPLTLTFKH